MSEIARIREQIELECEAALRALYAPRIKGPHELIEHQFAALADQIIGAKEQLTALVGTSEADTIIHTLFKKDWRGNHEGKTAQI